MSTRRRKSLQDAMASLEGEDRMSLVSKMVTFEGADMVGKSSIIEGTAERLRSEGYRVATARSPGSTELGDYLRGFLKFTRRQPMSNAVEAQLHFACFFQLFDELIYPALTDSDQPADVVLVDRFSLSTYMYQRDQSTDMLIKLLTRELYKHMGGYPLQIIVDASDEKLMERNKKGKWDRYDDNGELQKHVIEQYRVFTDRYPGTTVYNNGTLEEAVQDTINIVQQHVLLETTS